MSSFLCALITYTQTHLVLSNCMSLCGVGGGAFNNSWLVSTNRSETTHLSNWIFPHSNILQNSVSSFKLCVSLNEVNSIRNQESAWKQFILPKRLLYLLNTNAHSCYGSEVFYVSVVFYEFLQTHTCFALEINLGISFIGREYRNLILQVTEF